MMGFFNRCYWVDDHSPKPELLKIDIIGGFLELQLSEVHEASQKLFEDAQKRHQRLSERRILVDSASAKGCPRKLVNGK